MPDHNIIQKAIKGDHSAFRELYNLYAKEMYSVSYRITNHKEETKDVLQEAFLTSFEKMSQLKNVNAYRGWLKKIVINKSIAFLRLNKKNLALQGIEDISKESTEKNLDERYQEISIQQIKTVVQELPKGSRTIFTLYAFEGMIHQEIAEILNIKVSTSKSQYKYACNILKKRLTKFTNYEV